ncbi:hypothetical protein H9Q10_06460 [Eikenella sp. S3360]|uniref:Uncharacterized protein n=1 Tax=Eikenella glucosivorans TaxID=2766967 RepID=A0ABS0NAI2_9NEIS|nr:hypothetical protein [Eikenella glucosivorans]MBH5329310.1 hypothetical protein [Eikenella glucosivorans]
MLRKIFAFVALLPALAAAEPPIRDCRVFLLDMSTLGFRAGICQKNIEQPEVVRLRARERECSAISADGELNEEIRMRQLALHDEFVNEAVTRETVGAALAGKPADVGGTAFCRAYDKQLDEMARRYLQP